MFMKTPKGTKKVKRQWLEMTPTSAKKLSPKKLHAILSAIIPEIDRLARKLGDLNHVLELCKKYQLIPLSKKHGKVLQFGDILIAILKAPYTNIAEVLKTVERKHPELRREIAKIKRKNTTTSRRLVKTTVESFENGNPSKFPTSIAPYEMV